MPGRKRQAPRRYRIGRVSLYYHHGAWWIYYREGRKPIRRNVGEHRAEADQIAAQVNAQLASGAPSLLAFTPVSVAELRSQFLDYHDQVLRSSVGTVCRYRAATKHLDDFVNQLPKLPQAHEIRPAVFAAYLRSIEIAPNGHPHSVKRRLRDKGVQYILECCRALYSFAARRRHLPPYAGNPFAELPLDRLKIEDAKPIFVFDSDTEYRFLNAAGSWDFPIHFTLAKTGLRVGELVHLLIEDLDLDGGWLLIRNKTALGWRVKTGSERSVPLLPEVVGLLRRVVDSRTCGPVFLRQRFRAGLLPSLVGTRQELEQDCEHRQLEASPPLSRSEMSRVARTVWRDAGAIKADAIRTSFMCLTRSIGRPEATCPKSWRHTFATLLQDANVDPLIRQLTLGHQPSTGSGLGMTARYTHTRPETQRQQIEDALRRWPKSLELAIRFTDDKEVVS